MSSNLLDLNQLLLPQPNLLLPLLISLLPQLPHNRVLIRLLLHLLQEQCLLLLVQQQVALLLLLDLFPHLQRQGINNQQRTSQQRLLQLLLLEISLPHTTTSPHPRLPPDPLPCLLDLARPHSPTEIPHQPRILMSTGLLPPL